MKASVTSNAMILIGTLSMVHVLIQTNTPAKVPQLEANIVFWMIL